jgi:hypothetical protein
VQPEGAVKSGQQISGQYADATPDSDHGNGSDLFSLRLRVSAQSAPGRWQQHLERVANGGLMPRGWWNRAWRGDVIGATV